MEIPPKLHGSRVVDKDASGPACRRRQATRTNLLASEEAANENQERNPEPSHYFSSSQFQLPNSRIENFPTGMTSPASESEVSYSFVKRPQSMGGAAATEENCFE